MQTRSRRNSGVSSRASSTSPNSKCPAVANKTRSRKTPPKNNQIPNVVPPVQNKRRKLSANHNCTQPAEEDKYLTVALTDMLKDDGLCTKYDLHEKLANDVGDSTSDVDGNVEIESLSAMENYVASDGVLSEVGSDYLNENRKVVVRDNNFTITITKNFSPLRVEENHSCDGSQHSRSPSIDWETWFNANIKTYPRKWQNDYALINYDLCKITSRDRIFQSAELEADNSITTTVTKKPNATVCETIVKEKPLRNGVKNIKVQITNDFTTAQNKPLMRSLFSPTCSWTSANDGQMVFKVPLPPAKRPPSRPRKIIFSSGGSNCGSVTTNGSDSTGGAEQREHRSPVRASHEDDDALSISAR